MFVIKTLVLLCCATSLLAVSKFPAYLQKCKNDEHLNECFLKSAEAGIVNILKGDRELGIPNYLPIKVPYQLTLGTKDLTLVADNLIVTVTPAGIINETKWDTDKKNIVMKFIYQKVMWDYTGKLEGKFLDRVVSAHGHFTRLFENVLVPCNFQYDIVEVDGVKYASIIDGKCEYTAEKVTNTFENMDDDVQQFINKNWEKFDEYSHKQVEELIFRVVSAPFKAIFKAVPLDELFE